MECEDEYADNKKLIEIKDLRRQIPKNFSYFAVDFGLNNGYAHVIEHTESFPSSFAHEIIAGMMDLPANKWRTRKPQSFKEVKDKCDAMKAAWEPYDWTKKIDRNNR
ncbi:CWF19 protein 2 [Trichostrongylus colubriformis]|uniref:CWF19 protein 2 n=1 Tax=Trichostrongylus colubriformis TaxID=6319 RepID=A0AAN8F1P1_TRICO